MIKNIIIVILSLSVILLGTFALYQKDEADRSREMARQQYMEAMKLNEEVVRQRHLAEEHLKKVEMLMIQLSKEEQ